MQPCEIDELHLLLYPVARGRGPRLLPDEGAPPKLTYGACRSFENGVVYLNYRAQS